MHLEHRPPGYQRPHQRLLVKGVADGDLPVGADQPGGQFLGGSAMDDDPPDGGAALAGGPDRAEEYGAGGQVQVSVMADDHGVVAAQLQDGATQAGSDCLGHAPAGGDGAGEGD